MKEPKKAEKGECDICGCYSTRLIGGICQKAVCQRMLSENKPRIYKMVVDCKKNKT